MPERVFLAFDADWREPPGTVVKVFRTRVAAERFCYDEMSGYGYSVVEVEIPDGDDA